MSWNVIPPPEWLDTEEKIIEAGKYLYQFCPESGLAFDTETTGLTNVSDIPIMVSLSDGRRRFAFMADPWIRHEWIRDALLTNENIPKIGTNIKFDIHMLANIGIPVYGQLRDTLVMDWLFDENRFSHGLKETAKDHCGLIMKDFKEVFPMRRGTAKVPGETPGEAIYRVLGDPNLRPAAIEYSGLDAYASMLVHNFLASNLQMIDMSPNYTLWDYFLATETRFTRVLWNCERRGITICVGHLLAQKGPMEREMFNIEAEVNKLAGYPINIASPKQLQELFFDKLKLTPIKNTKGGVSGEKKPSTDEEVLSTWANSGEDVHNQIARLILKHRKTSKIYGTYVVGLLQAVDRELRCHTTLKQQGTVTGRLSSTEPNLQNIPRAKGDKFGIRHAFAAAIGCCLVVADYEQLEMRLMAHFSNDQKMIDAIRNGIDLHCFTVAEMFGFDYDEVYKAKKAESPDDRQSYLQGLRQAAKAIGFGLIYGIGPVKLGHDLTEELGRIITMEEAQSLIKKYFSVFPGVESYIKRTHKQCQKDEYVQTIVGRFRRLPGINASGGSSDDVDFNAKGVAAQAKRQAVNSIIQGTAADIAKAVMILADSDPVLANLGAKLLLQIHDELIFECPDVPEVIIQVKKRVNEIMEHPFEGFEFAVKLPVECKEAYTWAEAK